MRHDDDGGVSPRAESELFEEVYSTLLRFAGHHLANEHAPSLMAEELVNSACRRILRFSRDEVTSPAGLRYLAWRAMTQVLIDHARKTRAGKRIPRRLQIAIEEMPPGQEPMEVKLERLCTLDDLGKKIAARFSPRESRIFLTETLTPLTRQAIAEAEGISLRTVQRASERVYTWLREEIHGGTTPER